MQVFFNCCHGMFETQAGKWICSSHVADAGCGIDEEIIGDESGPAYKPHIQSFRAQDGSETFHSPLGRGHYPPRPVGSPGGPMDEAMMAKEKLQRLVRDFAHDVVGPGLAVKAQRHEEREAWPMLLRMDRKLARIELWPPTGSDVEGSRAWQAANSQDGSEAVNADRLRPGSATSSSKKVPTMATMGLPLQRVESLLKGAQLRSEEKPEPSRDSCMLTLVQRGGQDLRLIFDSMVERDRAYTCLRIFQMSVDNSHESTGNLDEEADAASSKRETGSEDARASGTKRQAGEATKEEPEPEMDLNNTDRPMQNGVAR
eukprot:TRINITY_DN114991_c0_g1_i1.p1 TRINITY_DN114991_c0_g1~~TRINITY_DN114991_c0_g1_i1.p1  ORF type:complete len:315 (+),score=51.70 TRINITY_DN114991_c0_g1_i1:146-1090(+)